MSVPEQIKKWREYAEAIWTKDHTLNSPYPKQHFIEGYLRRCQETEQAIKDARKQALEEAIAICKDFKGGGSNGIQAARVCAYNIGELLK